MKRTVIALAALAVAVSAQGNSGNERQVTVYLRNGTAVPFVLRAEAKALASQMFAGIGVTLNWHEVRPPALETGVIVIELVERTPAGLLPGAWAYALPYEGDHIQIFWDRMQLERSPRELLAHVMVYEITHILRGINRHSGEGIMNARWTKQERSALERRPLQFTRDDVVLIYMGMGARGPNPAGQAPVAMPLKVASISTVHKA
jgi:hypothetical protein